jgi:hypothetical protein
MSMGRHSFSFWHPKREERVSVKVGDQESATAVGQMLWDENLASVRHRYGEQDNADLPGPVGEDYEFAFPSAAFTFPRFEPVDVLKAVRCYEYQACEHPGWELSPSWYFCQALTATAVSCLPGYEGATWGAPDRFKAHLGNSGPVTILIG